MLWLLLPFIVMFTYSSTNRWSELVTKLLLNRSILEKKSLASPHLPRMEMNWKAWQFLISQWIICMLLTAMIDEWSQEWWWQFYYTEWHNAISLKTLASLMSSERRKVYIRAWSLNYSMLACSYAVYYRFKDALILMACKYLSNRCYWYVYNKLIL